MLLRTYRAVLAEASSQSIIEAAQRFTTGKVPGQSKTFAPSVAEFIAEVERRGELAKIKGRPSLPSPKYFPGPLAPFQIRQQKVLAEYSNRPTLFENVSYDQWRKLSANKEIPVGAVWCSLGIVFGPEPSGQSKAA